MRHSIRACSFGLLLALAAGCSSHPSATPVPAPQARNTNTKAVYPLTTCVVSGESLDSMGEPKVIQYEGREVRFCCPHCEADFRKDPQKYLKKLDEAAAKAATQPSTRPATK